MPNTFYTSDHHFGDPVTARLRGFGDDTDAHDEAIMENWRRVVRPKDTVHLLGDLASGRHGSHDRALAILADLPGTKHFIAGNHDPVSSIHRGGWRHQRRFLDVFESVRDFGRVRTNGHTLLMSHYPYLGEGDDHTEVARYQQWRLPDLGDWLLHGHTHNAEQRQHGRQIHVGLDAWNLMPVPIGVITDIVLNYESEHAAKEEG